MVSECSAFGGSGFIEGLTGTLVSGDCAMVVGSTKFTTVGDDGVPNSQLNTGNTFITTDYTNKRMIFGSVMSNPTEGYKLWVYSTRVRFSDIECFF